jgi:hypothetical protein
MPVKASPSTAWTRIVVEGPLLSPPHQSRQTAYLTLPWTARMRQNVVQWGAAFTFITMEGNMRSLIKPAALFLVLLVGVGLYLGWFSVTRSKPDAESDKTNINVSVDKAKMKSDIKKARGKVRERVRGIKD